MKRKDRQRKARKYDILVSTAVTPMKYDIFAEKNRYILRTSEDYKKTGQFSNELLHEHSANLKIIYSNAYRLIIEAMSHEIRNELKCSGGAIETKRGAWSLLLGAYIDKNAATRAIETARTTQNDIKSVIKDAFESGEPEETIIREMLTARGLSAYRSDTIARTEMSAAAMYASTTTAQDIQSEIGQPMKKFWIPVSDDRTRQSHLDMIGADGVDLNGNFDVGGESMFAPLDPKASPENIINCRCQLTYEVS